MDGGVLTQIGHPVVAALNAVSAGLNEAADADVWSLSDDDLTDALVRCEQLAARQAALSLRLIREADARDLGRRLGASSTTAWLQDRLRLRPGEAKARVDLAHRLDGGGHRSMPATATALAAGAMSADHARVIAKAMVVLPGGLSSEQERVAESELVGWARTYDPATVANLGRHLVHALDVESLEEREGRAHRERDMRFVDFGDGMTRFAGRGDTEAIALLRTALDPLAAPCPAEDGTPDPRTAGQRMFDALIELARRACQHGALPAGHGVRPHLAVIVSLDTLQHRTSQAGVFGRAGLAGGTGPGCGRAPTAPGELGWGGPISAEAVRRIGCDAGVTRVVTDPAGVPLDVGREHRAVTAGQWAALVVRDRGCAFPGCTRPPDWCITHHIKHWADGGETKLGNLVLLCGHHHRVVHHSGWTITMTDDRLPEFIPPPWIDPDQTPRRNTRPRYELADP
jgi:transposase